MDIYHEVVWISTEKLPQKHFRCKKYHLVVYSFNWGLLILK
jgi:hypothetical protein